MYTCFVYKKNKAHSIDKLLETFVGLGEEWLETGLPDIFRSLWPKS